MSHDGGALPKRLQDELAAADARLMCAAQHFSAEWKAFLAYALQLKQSAGAGVSHAALEDLLLRSQNGLVMLREMTSRREHKWRELLHWHPPTVPPSRPQAACITDTTTSDVSKRQTKLLHRQLRACYCYLARRQLWPPQHHASPQPTRHQREWTTQLQRVLAALRGGGGDLDSLAHYEAQRHALSLGLGRFQLRLRWLLHSHGYHVHQRMLELLHQQQTRMEPLSPAALREKARVATTAAGGAQCPIFAVTRDQVERVIQPVLPWLGISVATNGGEDPGIDKTHADTMLKLEVDQVFARVLARTALPEVAPTSEPAGDSDNLSLVVQDTQWDLLQPAIHTDEASSAGLSDTMLQNEWAFVGMDDATFLSKRLTGQAASHWTHSMVDLRSGTTEFSINSVASTLGLSKDALPSADLLDACYKARYLHYRRQRLRLLRHLNYHHYVAHSWETIATHVATVTKNHRSSGEQVTPLSVSITVGSEESTFCSAQHMSSEVEVPVVRKDNVEFVYAGALRDLAVIEQQLLMAAALCVERQQNETISSAPTQSVGMTVDRLQVLCDAYDCEVQYLAAKTSLVGEMVAVFDVDLPVLYGTEPKSERGSTYNWLMAVLRARPRVDTMHPYIVESYTRETVVLQIRRRLFQELRNYRESSLQQNRHDETVAHEVVALAILANKVWHEEEGLLKKADDRWCDGRVCTSHALRQAVYERILATWRSIVAVELGGGDGGNALRVGLEGSADHMLHGDGWRVALSASTVRHVLAIAFGEEGKSRGSVERAVDTLRWRRRLANQVYEARVLEEVYEFQGHFVSLLRTGQVYSPALFYVDPLATPKPFTSHATQLDPLAVTLFDSDSANDHHVKPRRSAMDWLARVLREDDIGTRSAALELQSSYVTWLAAQVSLGQLRHAESFEFTAAAPFVLLSTGASVTVATKYTDEIVEKVTETWDGTCWRSLDEERKSFRPTAVQLAADEATKDEVEGDHEQATEDEVEGDQERGTEDDVEGNRERALSMLPEQEAKQVHQVLLRLAAQPRLLVELDLVLAVLRRERRRMATLFDESDLDRHCAILERRDDHNAAERHTQWLHTKLAQLQRDMQHHTTTKHNCERSAHDPAPTAPDEEAAWLLALPPTTRLLAMFDTTRPTMDPTDETSDDDVVMTLHGLLDMYTRLGEALHAFHLDAALKVVLQPAPDTQLSRRRTLMIGSTQSLASISGGRELLRRWQTSVHESLRHLRDGVRRRCGSLVHLDLFAMPPREDVRLQYQLVTLRSALGDTIAELCSERRLRVRCTAVALAIESTGHDQRLCEASLAIANQAMRLRTPHQIPERDGVDVDENVWRLLRQCSLQRSTVTCTLRMFSALTNEATDAQLSALATWLDMALAWRNANGTASDDGYKSIARGIRHVFSSADSADGQGERPDESDGDTHPDSDEESNGDMVGLREHGNGNRRVSGMRLRMQTPRSIHGLVLSPAANSSTTSSQLLRLLQIMDPRVRRHGFVSLPTVARLTLHAGLLRVRLQVQWIDEDVRELQGYVDGFLQHRWLQNQEPRSTAGVCTGKNVVADALILLEPFVRDGSSTLAVPVDSIATILRTVEQKLIAQFGLSIAADRSLILSLEKEVTALSEEVETLRERVVVKEKEEQLQREAFACDRTYALQWALATQRLESATAEERGALDQQRVRDELLRGFEAKLKDTQVNLLATMHQFEGFRSAMAKEMKTQLRGAQAALVQQLVDTAGTASLERKTELLDALHVNGESGESAQVERENAALKQTLLKLQSLLTMEQQTRQVQREKETSLTQTQRLKEIQAASDTARLQYRVKQLESEVAKLSQERTLAQIQVAAMAKQQEAEAQRRREAKIRALSAPYRRRDASEEWIEDDDDQLTKPVQRRLPDFEEQQEAFEREHEVRVRTSPTKQQRPATGTAGIVDDRRLQRATRHYQNEIKRLQLQLAKEMRVKNALVDQVAQLKSSVNVEENQSEDPAGETQQPVAVFHCPPLVSASPRVRAASASVCSPRRPLTATAIVVVPKRPSTSCTPHLRVSPRADAVTSELSRLEAMASPSPQRKFEVVPRDAPIRGVAGVQTPLSARERLPYR